MCEICENYNIGDKIPDREIIFSCATCEKKSSVKLKNIKWVDNVSDYLGFFMHLTNHKVICCYCNAELLVGIYCTGIEAGELFMQDSEKKENNETH